MEEEKEPREITLKEAYELRHSKNFVPIQIITDVEFCKEQLRDILRLYAESDNDFNSIRDKISNFFQLLVNNGIVWINYEGDHYLVNDKQEIPTELLNTFYTQKKIGNGELNVHNSYREVMEIFFQTFSIEEFHQDTDLQNYFSLILADNPKYFEAKIEKILLQYQSNLNSVQLVDNFLSQTNFFFRLIEDEEIRNHAVDILDLCFDELVDYEEAWAFVVKNIQNYIKPVIEIISLDDLFSKGIFAPLIDFALIYDDTLPEQYYNFINHMYQTRKVTHSQFLQKLGSLLSTLIFEENGRDTPIRHWYSREEKYEWFSIAERSYYRLKTAQALTEKIYQNVPLMDLLQASELLILFEFKFLEREMHFIKECLERALQDPIPNTMNYSRTHLLLAIIDILIYDKNSSGNIRSVMERYAIYMFEEKIYDIREPSNQDKESKESVDYFSKYVSFFEQILDQVPIEEILKQKSPLLIPTIDEIFHSILIELSRDGFESPYIDPIKKKVLKTRRLNEPDQTFLLRYLPNNYRGYQQKDGYITRLHIEFTPRKIPPSITTLKNLEEITTDYYYNSDPDSRMFNDDWEPPFPSTYSCKCIPNYLRPYLKSSQIRGFELWENGYNALESLGITHTGAIYFWNAMDDDPEDLVQDCGMMILNGHIKYLEIDLESNEELDGLKIHIHEFPELERIFLRGYPKEIPDWLWNLSKQRKIYLDY